MLRSATSIAAVLLCLSTSSLFAQFRDIIWVEKQDLGPFWEGTYSMNVSAPPLKFLSFTSMFEDYTFNQSQKLYIRFYAPEATHFFLQGVEKEVGKYYTMQSKPGNVQKGWNRLGPWPVDNLLKRLYIRSDNLGILLRIREDNSRYVLPVTVSHSLVDQPSPYYKALFRLGKGISEGSFQVCSDTITGSNSNARILQTGRIFRHAGGSILQISIDKEKLGDKEGWFTVDLQLSEKGTPRKIPYRFYFYHPPK